MLSKRRQIVLVLLMLLVVCAVCSPWLIRAVTTRLDRHLMEAAQAALDSEDFTTAESNAARVAARSGDRQARLLAGEAAMMAGRLEEALAYLQPELEGTDADAVVAICAAADVHYRLRHAEEAERFFHRALELDPQQIFAKRSLAHLYTLQGRLGEALPIRFELLQAGQVDLDDLLLLGNPRALIDSDEVHEFEQRDQANPFWKFARAQILLRNSQSQQAVELLKQVIAARPEFPAAQAILGLALLDAGTPEDFWLWHSQLSGAATDLADYWVALGLWAQRNRQMPSAVRCFWEALRRDPTHRLASYQLSVALMADNKTAEAKPFEEQAGRLRRLTETLDGMFSRQRDDVETKAKAARQAEVLGRYWEAFAWYQLVLEEMPLDDVSRLAAVRLSRQIGPGVPRVVADLNPAALVDFSTYPLPNIERPAPAAPRDLATTSSDAIRFVDVTSSSGLDFKYFNGDDPQTSGRRMFEFTGGGVAVLDYDLDGWPDLYFTQGCHWPREEGQPIWRDQLYRNLGDGRLQNVTEAAGLGDDRFGQGVAAGDFNNDGWPDLYVGNVGVNRLYRNNGDGTFTEVTEEAGVGGEFWTTSCMIADINGDAIPDLYEVDYLAGDIAELMCPKTCSPAQFEAQEDRYFQGNGDGTFIDQTSEAGFLAPDGKGLGIVALDYNDSGQLSLFIANDTTANFLFVNDQPRGTLPHVTESAVVRGVAFDREGLAQACMGIAVDDSNDDGLLDIFVANFYHEFNTLYEQMPGGFFSDVSRERGLAEPSFLLLTFGTQFIDMDLDRFPDLITTNGHVDDFRDEGLPYHMPPHVFRNMGDTFVDLCESCGPFFEGAYLGRGLAKLDWNRDGRGDWAVNHLDSPAALVENATEPCGNYVGLVLVGTESERDAIGTTVWLTVAGKARMTQLVGGSGYHCSNERALLLGLGPAEVADRLEVRWPTGRRQVFEGIGANHVYVVVEGAGALVPLPKP
jgi:tetratricopeptide (TPR) repeat protein